MAEGVVLWDFDGTLAFRNGMWRGCLVDALTEIVPGHTVTAADLAPGLRDGFPWHSPETGHPGLSAPDEWWGALVPLFVSAYVRAGVDEDMATRSAQLVRVHYTDPGYWTVFPDSTAVLGELAEVGWCHMIVSNHVPELGALLRDLGLDEHFTAVVNSSLVGWEKPHRRIFEVALEQAGHPEHVWMVGDNPVADIGGAEAVGIPGILVNPGRGGLQMAARRILSGPPALGC